LAYAENPSGLNDGSAGKWRDRGKGGKGVNTEIKSQRGGNEKRKEK